MKRKITALTIAFLLCAGFPVRTLAAELLVPGGQLIALELRDNSVTVAAYDDALGENARKAGLQVGDVIQAIDDRAVSSAGDVQQALSHCGDHLTLTILRGSRRLHLRMTPCQTDAGPKLGVYLRQGVAGVGTITFFEPETNQFGTLGHGVCDSGGTLLQMTGGQARDASILSVKKGLCGSPGQLRGSAEAGAAIGSLYKNTPQGVFGRLDRPLPGEALPTADYSEIHTGPAVIRSTINDGGVQEYSVEILKIYPEDRSDSRNFLLRVTDPALLSATGGIVQGMSGSPIIQDGRLIGAVTHVLVNDPTTGYGIFIENMLDAAA